MSDNKKREKRRLVGVVVSDKMDKTVVVKVTTRVLHPLYKKYLVRSKKYKVHDENNTCHTGDLIQIKECRHISKDKYFTYDKTLKTAERNEVSS